MNAEFNVWLLMVGLVVGAGLVWVVMLDGRRREADIDAAELPREAAWLSAVLAEDGYHVSPEAAEQLLQLHRAYLTAPPPDPIAEAAPSEPSMPSEPSEPSEPEHDGTVEPAPEPTPEPPAVDEVGREPG